MFKHGVYFRDVNAHIFKIFWGIPFEQSTIVLIPMHIFLKYLHTRAHTLWTTSLVSVSIPYGYLRAHTCVHYPHFYNKKITNNKNITT
jgi:uncharacterized membrane protein